MKVMPIIVLSVFLAGCNTIQTQNTEPVKPVEKSTVAKPKKTEPVVAWHEEKGVKKKH